MSSSDDSSTIGIVVGVVVFVIIVVTVVSFYLERKNHPTKPQTILTTLPEKPLTRREQVFLQHWKTLPDEFKPYEFQTGGVLNQESENNHTSQSSYPDTYYTLPTEYKTYPTSPDVNPSRLDTASTALNDTINNNTNTNTNTNRLATNTNTTQAYQPNQALPWNKIKRTWGWDRKDKPTSEDILQASPELYAQIKAREAAIKQRPLTLTAKKPTTSSSFWDPVPVFPYLPF